MNRKTSVKCPKVLLANNVGGASGRDVLSGVLKYVNEGHAWNLQFLQCFDKLSPRLIRESAKIGIDGILGGVPQHGATFDALLDAPVPVALTDHPDDADFSRASDCAVLSIDDTEIARTAAEHFFGLGQFQSFGYANDYENKRFSRVREAAFERSVAARGHGLHVYQRDELAKGMDDNQSLVAWLRALPKPAAVMASFDYAALRVLEACREAGIRVPYEIAVIGVDNDEVLCAHSLPPLSSIRPNHVMLGYTAAKELDRLMRHAARHPDERLAVRTLSISGCTLFERESTRRVPPAGRLVERACAFIKAHAADGITPQDVVRYLRVSRSLADLRFRQLKNKSLLEAIDASRMVEIRKRLRETDTPIHTIAKDLHFSSPERLATYFRKHEGTSMSAYRRTARD